jgi:HPt (histidine-containing phosphotransfer) domain-containing protein
MLGLMQLSAACAALEQACRDGAVPADLLAEVRALLATSVATARSWAAART